MVSRPVSPRRLLNSGALFWSVCPAPRVRHVRRRRATSFGVHAASIDVSLSAIGRRCTHWVSSACSSMASSTSLLPTAPAVEAPNAAVDDAMADDGRERLSRRQQLTIDHLSEDMKNPKSAFERIVVRHLPAQHCDVVGGQPFVARAIDAG